MFTLIAGPCVIESEELVLNVAGQMKEINQAYEIIKERRSSMK